MTQTADSIRMSMDELSQFVGAFICSACGKMHPTWDWAQFQNTCTVCNARPTEEELHGYRRFMHTSDPLTPEKSTWMESRRPATV